jgi:hypothetical protein
VQQVNFIEHRHVRLLAVNIVKHPDVAGVLGYGQHETILRKREGYRGDEFRNHLAGAVERGNGEEISQRFASEGIEAYRPDVEEAAPVERK